MGRKGNSPGYRFTRYSLSSIAGVFKWVLPPMLISLAAPVAAAAERQGQLQVRIKDHREAISDFSKLSLTIAEILISVKPGLKFWQREWKSLAPNTTSIDLTAVCRREEHSHF
jgi:hypothetical protein